MENIIGLNALISSLCKLCFVKLRIAEWYDGICYYHRYWLLFMRNVQNIFLQNISTTFQFLQYTWPLIFTGSFVSNNGDILCTLKRPNLAINNILDLLNIIFSISWRLLFWSCFSNKIILIELKPRKLNAFGIT